nr:hypothetical protein CFP56_53839 [Quercus suber]
MLEENVQLWSLSGESCPEGTVPIRRTTEEDMLRASSVRRFGRKPRRHVRRDSSSNGHEHAVGYVSGDHLSQMWVISGSFGDDLNTIEAGWQVN